MVIGASIGVMDTSATEAEQRQGRYFISLFSVIRGALYAAQETCPDGAPAPEWALDLADAVLSNGEKR